MAASASTQTLEVGEGNRELGKTRDDKEGEGDFLLPPLPSYIQQNSEYLPNNCSTLPTMILTQVKISHRAGPMPSLFLTMLTETHGYIYG